MPATIADSVTPVDYVTGNGANPSGASTRSVRVTSSIIRTALAVSAVLLAAGGCATSPARPARHVATSAAPTATRYGTPVLTGNTVLTLTGERVDLALPAGITAMDATEVPGGWVVRTSETEQQGVWFAGTAGKAQRLGRLWGDYAVSPDGTVLVVAGLDGDTVVAYGLPDVHELARTAFRSGMGPMVAGVTADRRALLRGAQGSPGPSGTAVWDIRGNVLHPAVESWAWGVTGDGHALRRVDPPGRDANGKPLPGISCLDVVPLADTLPTARTGLCTETGATVQRGLLSPDGAWVALSTVDANTVLVRTEDLHAGRWAPVKVGTTGPFDVDFWTADGALVMSGYQNDTDRYARCTTDGQCEPLTLPAGGKPIPRVGR
jgi:hypothetical protein